MYSDDRLRDLCGVPPDRVAGLGVLDFWMEHVHPDDGPRVVELRRQMHEGEQERFSTEYRYLHPDGDERWIQHLAGAAMRDAGGRAVRTYGVLRDVTDRKRAEEESRELSRRLIRAQEEERALLARELHDDVSQRLAVLAIEVGRAELAAADGEQAEAMQARPRGTREPERGRPLPGLPAAPLGPGGARTGRGAARGVRAADARGRARRLRGPRSPAARAHQGLRALPVQGRAGSPEQRGSPRRGHAPRPSRSGRSATGWSSPCPTTASDSSPGAPERGCTSAWPA